MLLETHGKWMECVLSLVMNVIYLYVQFRSRMSEIQVERDQMERVRSGVRTTEQRETWIDWRRRRVGDARGDDDLTDEV